jgi:hypothetical protein
MWINRRRLTQQLDWTNLKASVHIMCVDVLWYCSAVVRWQWSPKRQSVSVRLPTTLGEQSHQATQACQCCLWSRQHSRLDQITNWETCDCYICCKNRTTSAKPTALVAVSTESDFQAVHDGLQITTWTTPSLSFPDVHWHRNCSSSR